MCFLVIARLADFVRRACHEVPPDDPGFTERRATDEGRVRCILAVAFEAAAVRAEVVQGARSKPGTFELNFALDDDWRVFPRWNKR